MKFFLIAGEPSGDAIGADLIARLETEVPTASFHGAGGRRMAAAGQDQIFDLTEDSSIGMDALWRIPRMLGRMGGLVREAVAVQPDAVIFIDCSGFNLPLLRRLRAALPQTRMIYYVSPQVWASRAQRAAMMERHLDLLLAIFPFEPDWFRQHAPGLKVVWVGHPIRDRLFLPEEMLSDDEWQSGKVVVSLLPGSRRPEVRRHLPLLLQTAMVMNSVQSNFTFLCLAPTDELAELEQQIIREKSNLALDVHVLSGYTASHVARSHLALVATGTATLECAIAGTPMIAYYKVDPLTYQIGRWCVKVPFLSMVNLLLNRPAVPECIQGAATPHRLARAAVELLASEAARRRQQEDFSEVIELLGEPGAGRRAARAIVQSVRDNPAWRESRPLGDQAVVPAGPEPEIEPE